MMLGQAGPSAWRGGAAPAMRILSRQGMVHAAPRSLLETGIARRAAARGLSATQSRANSTQSSSSAHAATDPATARSGPDASSSSSSGKKSKSKHQLVYREIWPPLVRVLAYGSGVYFALHLIQQYLDGQEQRRLELTVRTQLEAEVREQVNKRRSIEEGTTGSKTSTGSGWFSWLPGRS